MTTLRFLRPVLTLRCECGHLKLPWRYACHAAAFHHAVMQARYGAYFPHNTERPAVYEADLIGDNV